MSVLKNPRPGVRLHHVSSNLRHSSMKVRTDPEAVFPHCDASKGARPIYKELLASSVSLSALHLYTAEHSGVFYFAKQENRSKKVVQAFYINRKQIQWKLHVARLEGQKCLWVCLCLRVCGCVSAVYYLHITLLIHAQHSCELTLRL